MSASPLEAVTAAVFTVLNVSTLTSLATGGVWNTVPQGTVAPYVFFSVNKDRDIGGFGTYPGHGDVSEIDLRIHALGQQGNTDQSQAMVAAAVGLMFNGTISVSGYNVPSNMPLSEVPIIRLEDQIWAGVTVYEIVALLRLVADNQS